MLRAWAVGVIWLIGLGAPTAPEDTPEVVVQARPATDEVSASQILEELDDGDVLRIRVEQGVAQAAGLVRQCVRLPATSCFNSFPVQFDDEGVARFQYEIEQRSQCGPAGSCVIVVIDEDGERIAVAATVFGGAAPPRPTVTMTPAGPYHSGDVVRVDVTKVTPGVVVDVAYCGSHCGPIVSSVADSTGAASATVTVGASCRDCYVAVTTGVNRVTVPVEFDTTRYDGRRLVTGLLAAVALLIVAWRIIVAIDWRPPSEADAPELDAPELDAVDSSA